MSNTTTGAAGGSSSSGDTMATAMTKLIPPRPSSTLVNMEEHSEVHLVHLLAEAIPPASKTLLSPTFTADCENCIANADAPGLLRTVLNSEGAMTSLMSLNPTNEAVSAFGLLASLLDRVPIAVEQTKLVVEMMEALKGKKADYYGQPRKAVAMMAALYNLRSAGTDKALLLGRIVTLSASSAPDLLGGGGSGDGSSKAPPSTQLGSMVQAGKLKRLLEGWEVPLEERRKIYRDVAGAMGQLGDGEVNLTRKQRLLLLYIESFTDAASLNKEVLAAAKEAAILAIRDPITLFAEQRSMMGLPAVAALSKDPSTKPLLDLLQVFSEGKLEDYKSYVSSHPPKTLDNYGLSPDTCVRHMRLLSLCSLAAEHEEIPYDAIATTLQVDPDDVEHWVVAAVSSGLLQAKMDQLQKVVMVERCVVRKFGHDQWKLLQVKLDAWKRNVKVVLQGLKQSQALHEGAATATATAGAAPAGI